MNKVELLNKVNYTITLIGGKYIFLSQNKTDLLNQENKNTESMHISLIFYNLTSYRAELLADAKNRKNILLFEFSICSIYNKKNILTI